MKRYKLGSHMEIGVITVSAYETNCYIVKTDQGAFLVDPGANPRGICAAIAEMHAEVTDIILTHSHDDHMGAAAEMVARTGATLYAHPLDVPRIEDPWFEGKKLPIQPAKVDVTLTDGQTVRLAGLDWKVLHTPGHTVGSMCLFNQDALVLFSGDTLFNCGVGRTDFEGGSVAQMTKSLRRLAQLPGQTLVLSGHGPSTTIAAEKRNLGL